METKYVRIDKTDPARIAVAEFSGMEQVLADLQNRFIQHVTVYEVCKKVEFVERPRVVEKASAT